MSDTQGGAVGVLGAGSWGTALAIHISRCGRQAILWGRSPELIARLRQERENSLYLPGVALPPKVLPTANIEEVASCAKVLVVVPSHGFRAVLKRFLAASDAESEQLLVSATKGIEGESLARMSEVSFEEAVRARRTISFAVISGPSFATELVAGSPTAAVVASEDVEARGVLQELLSGANLRLYSTSDVVGVELGGAVKNVIAIAAGVVSGLGYGHNTLAALLTRGLHEMTRLGRACGGRAGTFSGLAGLGDLVLTCTGSLSRNRSTGEALARGETLAQIEQRTAMVAEGVRNSRSILSLAQRRGVEMPITEQMVQVLYEGKDPRIAVEDLMSRDLKSESQL